jgi:hypothetical protein
MHTINAPMCHSSGQMLGVAVAVVAYPNTITAVLMT